MLTYLIFLLSSYTISQEISLSEKSLNDSLLIGKIYLIKSNVEGIDVSKNHLLDTGYYRKVDNKFRFIRAERTVKDSVNFFFQTFDTGYVVIGPFGIINESKDTIFSKPLLRYVKYAKISVDKGYKKDLPYTKIELKTGDKIALFFLSYWWIFALLIAVTFALIYYLKQQNKPKEVKIEAPKISLTEEYLSLLDNITAKQLWQQGKIKEYHTEVTFTIRSYISKRYKIKALEKTSTQISSALKAQLYDDELKQKMTFLLNLSDMVKFAKQKPSPEENEQIIQIAKEFIHQTKKEDKE